MKTRPKLNKFVGVPTHIWRKNNPKKTRWGRSKFNYVCLTCKKTCRAITCPICGTKTRRTLYPVPRKGSRRWRKLITHARTAQR